MNFEQLDIEHKEILILNHLAFTIAIDELAERIDASEELILDEIWEFATQQLKALNTAQIESMVSDIEGQHELARALKKMRIGIINVQIVEQNHEN